MRNGKKSFKIKHRKKGSGIQKCCLCKDKAIAWLFGKRYCQKHFQEEKHKAGLRIRRWR